MANDRTLYVLRHAKSDWSDDSLSDFQRPLAERGRRAVGLLAHHVDEAGIEPEVVISSPARRARQTIEAVLPDVEVVYDDDFYRAGVLDIVARVREVDDEVASVMVVGHNPGLHDLVEVLADTELDKFPTGALATLAVRTLWSELGPGDAELVDVIRPRELD